MRVHEKLAIYDWAKENNLKSSQKRILLEIWRRIHQFHNGDLDEKLLLLAYPSQVKSCREFFKTYSGERPRCLSWYNLSESGKQLMKKLNKKLEWRKELNLELFEG